LTPAWRICARKHARTAFSGEGARLYGGRWNPPGVALVYCAATLSLAALELLVDLDPEEAPGGLTAVQAVIPDTLRIHRIEVGILPRNWRRYPAPLSLPDIGSAWITGGLSPVLSVPSAVIPKENNYLLNPAHPDFRHIKINPPAAFHFDPRMWK
jgi:RES domain-containing protein